MELEVPAIHVITPNQLPSFDEAASTMHTLGTLGALHVRSRTANTKQIYDLAAQLAKLQHDTGCMLVINERVDIAMAVGARGIQLPANSFTPGDVRKINSDIIIGLSTHPGSDGQSFDTAGANWIFAGNLFETSSHPGQPGFGLSLLRDLTSNLRVPVIAIGGIKAENMCSVLKAGAKGVAIQSGAWGVLRGSPPLRSLKTPQVPFEPGKDSPMLSHYISEHERCRNSGRKGDLNS